jgi:glutamate-1-semialdehyde 2,1-aminomutase
MSATDSDTRQLAARAREITARELDTYRERTSGSQRATERARKVLPLGVSSSFQAYDPHPIVVRKSHGSWMEDVDGHRYIDFDMGFGALFAGHARSSTTARCT